jgi:acetyl/propionyl-CoA carboxylase alpha subunit
VSRAINTLLVANRGEIACRVMRAATSMGMATVAVYADPDAEAKHVRVADRSVPLHGTTSAETYLVAEKIIAAALASGAQAIHPGYGFLSENAGFAEAVTDAGLIWVGPPPAAIRAMGDKITALTRMTEAGVPTLPRAEVSASDPDAAVVAAEDVGYPLMVKASAGGGGKGMRIVTTPADLPAALAGAQREAAGAFGDDRVFLERFVEHARHIEVQVFGDADGKVHHLFERECSVQRRHQKVIEEAPSPFVDPELREEVTRTAVAAAAAVDYVGAGTVELIMGADRRFYFLEMNTRLQVEHPVTELVSGVDLVRQQLRVAQGLPAELDGLRLNGAAIEVRVYAEDPAADFLPQSGRLVGWAEPSGIRVDSGIEEGDEVSPYFDPMLAKLIAHGTDRREAAAKLVRGLRDLRVQGVRTNRDFLINLLEHPAFLDGDTTIDFIDRVKPARGRTISDGELRRAVLTAGLYDRAAAQAARTAPGAPPPAIPPGIPAGFGTPVGWLRRGYVAGEEEIELAFRDAGNGRILASVGGTEMSARVHGFATPAIDVEIDGVRETLSVTVDDATERVWVQGPLGEVALSAVPRFPPTGPEIASGSLIAPMNGAVVAVEVTVGDEVQAGQVILILEAMKMEHQIIAPTAGVVTEVFAALGEPVAADTVLAVVEENGAVVDGVPTAAEAVE